MKTNRCVADILLDIMICERKCNEYYGVAKSYYQEELDCYRQELIDINS